MRSTKTIFAIDVPVSLAIAWDDDEFDSWALDEFDAIPVPPNVKEYLKEAITAAGDILRLEVDHRLVDPTATLTIKLARRAFDA